MAIGWKVSDMKRQGSELTGVRAGRGRGGFVAREDGSFIIFGLFIFLAMIMAAGVGIDLMRYEAQRARLQATLDRAILAAASLDQPLDPKTVVIDYFTKAGLDAYIDPNDVKVTNNANTRRVEASASLEVPTAFMRFTGIDYLNAPAQGAAEESVALNEISLVVDVSGSMGWASYSGQTKLYELKKAARTFANMILCNPNDTSDSATCTVDPNKASITLVPYATQVLLGSHLASSFTLTTENTRNTCVTFFPADFGVVSVDADTAIQRTGDFDPYRGRNESPSSSNGPCQTDSWREVHPYEDRAADLRAEINALQANGSTSIDLGMKWGAALLDPDARNAITRMNTLGRVSNIYVGRPLDYDTRGLEKVIVLMTDGDNQPQDHLNPGFFAGPSPIWKGSDGRLSIYDADNNRYWWPHRSEWRDHAWGTGTYQECTTSWVWDWSRWRYVEVTNCYTRTEASSASQLSFPQLWDDYTIAWWNQWNFLPDAAGEFDHDDKNGHLDAICTAAKNAGITVFTIGFEVEGDLTDWITDDPKDVMRDCASYPSYYFDANGLNLTSAFSAIGREISKLRLVN
ncbi:pilus assembly protein TadG-related protein [uncultured Maritimibacter sp.]|uniref:pilus assembly protein TadG-related protein n=1 Tax=uncultured Maritimibacter sp. TaxID=991866 RepID=UPI002627DE88|nr:pilus assembly protein TadG-related protein [uncultured Maritimibacter sp.]